MGNIIDVDEFTSPIVAPTAGNPRVAFSVEQGMQGLANRTFHHENRLTTAEARILGVASEVTLSLLLGPASVVSGWTIQTNGSWKQTTASDSSSVYIPVQLPRFGVLKRLRVTARAGLHSRASMPATTAKVDLAQYDVATDAQVPGVAVFDPETVPAQYETLRTFESDDVSIELAASPWFLWITGESGSLTGYHVREVQVDIAAL